MNGVMDFGGFVYFSRFACCILKFKINKTICLSVCLSIFLSVYSCICALWFCMFVTVCDKILIDN